MSKWTGWGLLLWFLFFPNAVKRGVLNGMELGGRVLIPSIFPYLVLSGILIKTGGLQKLSQKIKLGNLSIHAKEMLIPSLFCGYPTGARLPALAYDNGSITKQEFLLLFCFANIPGFGFSVSYLGSIFNSMLTGFFIYLSFLLSSLTMVWFFGKKLPEQVHLPVGKTSSHQPQKLSDALVESVSESAQTMVSLLCFVCFFSSLIELLKILPLPTELFPIGAAFLEITTGLSLLSQSYPMEAVVFFCGFSGLSVLFQSLYFDKRQAVNFLHLFLGRIVYGILSVGFLIILRFLSGLV